MNDDLTPFEAYFAANLKAILEQMDPDYRAELQALVEHDPDLVGMKTELHPMGGYEIIWAGRRIGWIAPFPDPVEVA